MNQNGGWIELVQPGSTEVRARAHLLVNDLPLDGGWRGHLESLRLRGGNEELDSGTYVALFHEAHDVHVVDVELAGDHAHVWCEAELPANMRELSDGE
jgi:hypothetical protein